MPGIATSVLAILVVVVAVRVHAASLVRGTIVNAATGAPIVGATVDLRQGAQPLASVKTDAQGRFEATVDAGGTARAENVEVVVTNADFASASRIITIASGQASAFDPIALLPQSLAACSLAQRHAVVVGHFRLPVGGPAGTGDLSNRVADGLTYSLLTRLQRLHLPTDHQPIFQACDGAQPASLSYGGKLAQALRADVLLSGDVEPATRGVDVKAFVSDAFGLFQPPERAVNHAVDLNDPGAAEFDPAMHAAVLTAVAQGYASDKQFAECVEVAVAAEQILGGHPTETLKHVGDACRTSTGNAGLLRGATP